MTLIDTAEMYGDGGAEEVVGEAIAGRRERGVPRQQGLSAQRDPAGRDRRVQAQPEAPGDRPPRPVPAALARQHSACADGGCFRSAAGRWQDRALGRVELRPRRHGRAARVPDGDRCAANQVLYHLGARGIEWELLPLCRSHAYRGHGLFAGRTRRRLLRQRRCRRSPAGRGSPAQLALAWVLRQRDVVAIPKAADSAHVHDNLSAANLRLDRDVCEELDRAFPAPRRATSCACFSAGLAAPRQAGRRCVRTCLTSREPVRRGAHGASLKQSGACEPRSHAASGMARLLPYPRQANPHDLGPAESNECKKS